jgi:hypothetical protein
VQSLGEESIKQPMPYNLLRTLEATTNKVVIDEGEEEDKENDKEDLLRKEFSKKFTKKVV